MRKIRAIMQRFLGKNSKKLNVRVRFDAER